MNNKGYISVKELALMAFLTALLFVQEQLLSFLPNIQFTIFLLILYSKKLGFVKTSIIVIVHTILDNLVMGSFNAIYFPFMLTGWLFIPIGIKLFARKTNSALILAIYSIIFAFLYSFVFLIPNVIILNIDIWAYLIADIPFEIILALSSFITTLWLYQPCAKAFDRLLSQNIE